MSEGSRLLMFYTVNQQILQHFLPNATRLIRLRVFKGSVLKDTGHLIQLYCPNFSKLQIFNW